MNKIVEEALTQITQDAQALQAEVEKAEYALSKKKADLIAMRGAIQVLQHVLRKAGAAAASDPAI